MLKHCGGFVEGSVKAEYKHWDPVRIGTDGTRRVPDVTCTDKQGKEYVIGARIFWNAMSESSNGFMAYTDTGAEAEDMCIDPASAATITRVLAYSARTFPLDCDVYLERFSLCYSC